MESHRIIKPFGFILWGQCIYVISNFIAINLGVIFIRLLKFKSAKKTFLYTLCELVTLCIYVAEFCLQPHHPEKIEEALMCHTNEKVIFSKYSLSVVYDCSKRSL